MVPPLHRYYQGAPTSRRPSPHAPSARAAVPPEAPRLFASAGGLVQAPTDLDLVQPDGPAGLLLRRWRRLDLPGSWTNPCARATASDPGGTSVPSHCGTAVLPSPRPRGAPAPSTRAVSRFNPAARYARCLRFAGWIAPVPRKTRSSAGGQPLPGGCLTHWVHSRQVSRCLRHRSSHPRLGLAQGAEPPLR
jgi:hypothetical protein